MTYFCAYRRKDGRKTQTSLGRVNVITAAQARDAAINTLSAVNGGREPNQEKRIAKTNTLRAFLHERYGPWVTANRKSAAGTLARINRCFFDFSEKALTEIDVWSVDKWRIKDALGVLEAKAVYAGPEHPVSLRVGRDRENIYLDLCNPRWEVVEINKEGWKILSIPPVKFRRSSLMGEILRPEMGNCAENILLLKNSLNVDSDEDFKLIVSFLINSLSPEVPYLTLVLYGEQGTGKTTMVRTLRSLVDPSSSPVRSPPKNSDDLIVAAKHNFLVVTDNMSELPDWLSDDYCRLSTGGALSKRKNYSDDEEVVLNAKRPIILNGIEDFVVRGDLASRSVTITLYPIDSKSRKREKTLKMDFEQNRPKIIGALLTALSSTIRLSGTFEMEETVRMADSLYLLSSAEATFGWAPGSALKAFQSNQQRTNEVILNSSPIFSYFEKLAPFNWTGSATDLLNKLNEERLGPEPKQWPRNAQSLSNKIRRINPLLESVGVEIIFGKTSGNHSHRLVQIRKVSNIQDARDASTPSRHQTVNCDASDDGDAENDGFLLGANALDKPRFI